MQGRHWSPGRSFPKGPWPLWWPRGSGFSQPACKLPQHPQPTRQTPEKPPSDDKPLPPGWVPGSGLTEAHEDQTRGGGTGPGGGRRAGVEASRGRRAGGAFQVKADMHPPEVGRSPKAPSFPGLPASTASPSQPSFRAPRLALLSCRPREAGRQHSRLPQASVGGSHDGVEGHTGLCPGSPLPGALTHLHTLLSMASHGLLL